MEHILKLQPELTQTFTARVVGILRYADFARQQFYSLAKQQPYGVVGVRIEPKNRL